MSGKRPTDHLEPSAKRRNDRQLTKDDESDDEGQAVDPGNFARASEEVLKQRKIVKARRGADTSGGAAQANPFAGIQLAASTAGAGGAAPNPFAGVSLFGASATPVPTPEAAPKPEPGADGNGAQDAKPAAPEAPQEGAAAAGAEPDKAATKEEGDQQTEAKAASGKPAAAPGGFGAFGSASGGGLAFGKSGFGSASGGFGSLAGASTGAAFSFGAASSATTTSSIFSFSSAAAPSFSFAAASSAAGGDAATTAPAAGTSLFGATPASGTPIFGAGAVPAAKPELPEEQAVTTGEEDERTVFSGDGALFEFDAAKQWRERGRGEMRVNVAPSGQARLVMRQKGNLRLLMNANLWAEMQVSKMEGGKGVTFACINAAGAGDDAGAKKEGEAAESDAAPAEAAPAPKLATFALRIKGQEVLDQFVAAVNAHKAASKKEAAAPDP